MVSDPDLGGGVAVVASFACSPPYTHICGSEQQIDATTATAATQSKMGAAAAVEVVANTTGDRGFDMSEIECVYDQVAEAAAQFQSRWTLTSLKRVDPDMYEAIEEQRQLYHEAQLRGDIAELEYQGGGMCRGWAAAAKRMEEAKEPDDSYQLGVCQRTGSKIAIGMHRSSATRVMELQEGNVVFLTPDEIAAMFYGLQGVAAVKELWPDSEIISARPKAIDLYDDEPAKEDAL